MSTAHQSADPNLALVKAMGSKRGYDPMPPDQHEWQRAEGEPPLYRLWSWMCAHTIRARFVAGKQVRTPYATRDDGVTPATLVHAATDLDMDSGHLSRVWAAGAEAGLWRRDGQTRRLYLNGSVTAADVRAAHERRALDCTVNLTPQELLKIKELPKERQDWFYERWNPAQEYGAARVAAAVARERDAWAALNDSILRQVGIEKKRTAKPARDPVPVPQLLFEFVQSTTEQSNGRDRTVGENEGENLTRTAPPSLLRSENPSRELQTSSSSVVTEAAQVAAALQIDDDAATNLLTATRKAEPTITPRQIAALAALKLSQMGRKVPLNRVGFLLTAVPKAASGATLEQARRQAQREIEFVRRQLEDDIAGYESDQDLHQGRDYTAQVALARLKLQQLAEEEGTAARRAGGGP